MWRAPCVRRPLHRLRGDGLSSAWPNGRQCAVEARRRLVTLAIESSCDDTSVAVLEKDEATGKATLHFHEKVTSNNKEFGGVNPKTAVISHEESLAPLIQRGLAHLPSVPSSPSSSSSSIGAHDDATTKPGVVLGSKLLDFVSVTRGPGMRASVATGLNMAKGLALGLGVPVVGVNHMQAHALTPRLASALNRDSPSSVTSSASSAASSSATTSSPFPPSPAFPFLSLLVSGGHTMILRSSSLASHQILSETVDIAAGDALDKMARMILPADELARASDVSYARALEAFVFGDDGDYTAYEPPRTRADEIKRHVTPYGWSLPVPFSNTRGGQRAFDSGMTFTGLCSAVERIVAAMTTATATGSEGDGSTAPSDSGPEDVARSADDGTMSRAERRMLGYEVMRVVFEHIATRVCMCLESAQSGSSEQDSNSNPTITTLIASGGVAANRFLRHVLRRVLDAKGHEGVGLAFPPLELCTDNAAMIAWAGVEMYEAGWESALECLPLRKWSLDPAADDGGIFGVGGWKRRE